MVFNMNSTTLENIRNIPSEQISNEINAYLGKVNITAQATYDRWPEASGMRRVLWELAKKANISIDQLRYDLEHAKIECDGGRW
jgi:hypothetical protein